MVSQKPLGQMSIILYGKYLWQILMHLFWSHDEDDHHAHIW